MAMAMRECSVWMSSPLGGARGSPLPMRQCVRVGGLGPQQLLRRQVVLTRAEGDNGREKSNKSSIPKDRAVVLEESKRLLAMQKELLDQVRNAQNFSDCRNSISARVLSSFVRVSFRNCLIFVLEASSSSFGANEGYVQSLIVVDSSCFKSQAQSTLCKGSIYHVFD